MLLLVFGLVSMVLSKTRNAEAAFIFALLMVVVLRQRLRKIAFWCSVVAGSGRGGGDISE